MTHLCPKEHPHLLTVLKSWFSREIKFCVKNISRKNILVTYLYERIYALPGGAPPPPPPRRNRIKRWVVVWDHSEHAVC
jgi:hypothetical protein